MSKLDERLLAEANAISVRFRANEARLLPTGGTTGQVLTKTGAGDNVFAWSAPASAAWGGISGSISAQTDLAAALAAKANATDLSSYATTSALTTGLASKQAAGSYLTANQTITLSGDATGSGSTAITVTIGANKVTRGMLAAATGATILGATAAGNIADLTAAQVRALLPPSVQTITSAATITPTFSDDGVKVTALAVATTLANPTGTAVSMAGWAIRIKDNGTARAITYDTQYRAIGVTLPTTTVIGKTLYLGCIWNGDDSKVDIVAVVQEA